MATAEPQTVTLIESNGQPGHDDAARRVPEVPMR